MRVLMQLALVAALAGPGCYQPSIGDCQYTCTASSVCPAGLACQAGVCRVPGAIGGCDGDTDAAADAVDTSDANVDASLDTPIDASVDTPIDASVDTPIDTPIDAPMVSLTVAVVGRGVVTGPPGLTCAGTCRIDVAPGATITLAASLPAGTRGVTFTGCQPDGPQGCSLTVSADTTVTADFLGGGLVWSKHYGGTPYYGREFVHGVVAAPDGSTTAVGAVSGGTAIDFGGTVLTSTGLYDAWVVKHDAGGARRWARMFGAGSPVNDVHATSVALTSDQDAVVIGTFRGTLSLDGLIVTSAGEEDVFIALLDGTTGAARWLRRVGGGGGDQAFLVAAGPGRIAVVGLSVGGFVLGGTTVPANHWFAVALDGAGATAWVRALLSSTDVSQRGIKGLLVASDGDAIVAGSYGGPGPELGVLGPAAVQVAFLARLATSDGATRWARAYGGSAPGGRGASVATRAATFDRDGKVVLAGVYTRNSNTTESFAGVAGGPELPMAGPNDAFVAVYEPDDGDHLRSFRIGDTSAVTDHLSAIAAAPTGELIIAGSLLGPVTFGAQTLTPAGASDGYLHAVSATGQPRWVRQFGGPAVEDFGADIGERTVTVTSTGLVVAAGELPGDHTAANACSFDGQVFDGETGAFLLAVGR